jgi:A/G-specific adenine glycosylase
MAAPSSRHRRAAAAALKWYHSHGRDLPWRTSPQKRKSMGVRPDPYHVWLSEIMLQQTTVATVKTYFEKFTSIWPTVSDLAAADRNDVLSAWAGLGYYARARNLHKTAKMVADDHGGAFPDTEDGLRSLPGIGPYTAAAIAAIAFGRRAVVVDGNIERLTARWDRIEEPLPKAKAACYAVMDALTPKGCGNDFDAGDFAQALMDIGSGICTPPRKSSSGLTAPSCPICPLAATCIGKDHDPAHLPLRPPKKPRPDRHGHALVVTDAEGHVVLTRRADKGLLGGLEVFPGNDWPDGGGATPDDGMVACHQPAAGLLSRFGRGVVLNTPVEHVFTHFRVLITVEVIRLEDIRPDLPEGFFWVHRDNLPGRALPTVMVKCAAAAEIVLQ